MWSPVNILSTIGGVVVLACVVAIVRAAILFTQGFDQGIGARQRSDIQSIFQKGK